MKPLHLEHVSDPDITASQLIASLRAKGKERLAERGRAAAEQQAAERHARAPVVAPLSRFPLHDFGAIVPCPGCHGATEDGRNVRDPFVGRACFWCGACWDSDGKGKLARMERTVLASMPSSGRIPEGRAGMAWREP